MSLLFPSYFPEWGRERLGGCGEAFLHGGKLSPLLAPSLAVYIPYEVLLLAPFPWGQQACGAGVHEGPWSPPEAG